MVLQGESDKAAKPTLRYQFIMPDESVVETTEGVKYSGTMTYAVALTDAE